MAEDRITVGIDVSQDALDISLRPTEQSCRSSYLSDDLSELTETPLGLSPKFIVVEATGGLELPLTAALCAAELPVALANPRQTRDFAGPSVD